MRFVLRNEDGNFFTNCYRGRYNLIVEGSTDDLQKATIFSGSLIDGKLVTDEELPTSTNWTLTPVRIQITL